MGWPGEQRAVQRLVEEYYEPLYCYAYRLCGSAADAEDLTQDAFCKAQQKLGQLRDPARAKAWLFSILRNNYLHRLRERRLEAVVSPDGLFDVVEPPAPDDPEIEPEQLQQALGELPEAFRTPLILFYFEEFSYRDIAEQMDLPIGTVMSRLARAKAHLRSRLLAAAPAEVGAPGPRRATDGL